MDASEKNGNTTPFERIRRRRAAAGRLVAGVAAVADIETFKASQVGKPPAKDFRGIFSRESQSRPPCVLKQAAGYLSRKGMISLGGGLPSSEYFPYSEIALRVPKPPHFLEESMMVQDSDSVQTARIGKHDVGQGISEYDLSIALNYGQAAGSPQMLRFITEHTELVFNPPYSDWQVCQTAGSTAALEQAIRMLCDEERGDAILTEEYTFATALDTIRPQGIKVFGVKMDQEGLLPDELDHMLSSWDAYLRGARKPHVIYTIPCGQNPTGATQGVERRKAVYAVCQKHDIYIIEDDPYYFLQMQPYQEETSKPCHNPSGAAQSQSQSLENFVAGLVPSFLSLDIDGRVLRMDSFSKVLVPGSRMGWITASKQVVQTFLRHAEVANQGPGGLAQVVLWKLLDETWGHEGYLAWLLNLKMSYTARRNMLLAACEEFLPRDLVSWTPPSTGMFLWLKVDHRKHPAYPGRSILEIEQEIFHGAIENGVLCARGSWFRAEPHLPPSELFFRTTFASASEETMSVAIQRLSAAIRRSFQYGES